MNLLTIIFLIWGNRLPSRSPPVLVKVWDVGDKKGQLG